MVASTAPGRQISSSVANSACLTDSSSTTASTTRSRSARSSSREVPGDPGQRGVALGRARACRAAPPSPASARSAGAHRGRPSRRRGRRTDVGSRPWRTPRRCRWPWCPSPRRRPGDRRAAPAAPRRRAGCGVCGVVDDDRRVRPRRRCRSRGRSCGRSSPAVTICLSIGLGACSRSRDCRYIVSRISYAVSSPIRSSSASGPIGRPQPSRIAASMSSRVAYRVSYMAGGVVEVAEQQRVGDEAGLVADDDRRLAEAGRERLDLVEHVLVGDDGADHLDEASAPAPG